MMNDEVRELRGVLLGLVVTIVRLSPFLDWQAAGADLQDDYQMALGEAQEQIAGPQDCEGSTCRVER